MDSFQLLAREDEFKKLNKQLEMKTESLMKEIEYAMQKPDIFTEFSKNLNPTKTYCTETKVIHKNLHTKKIKTETVQSKHKDDKESLDKFVQPKSPEKVCDCCTDSKNNISGELEFLYAFVSVNVKDNVIPQSFLKDRVTVENVCKYLSAKVKLLQEQIDKLQATIEKKASQCEAHLSRQAELEGERMTLVNKSNNLRSSAADLKAKFMNLQNMYNEKDRLYKEQRSETDRLTAELKKLRCRNVTAEARCASHEETVSTLKQQLEAAKLAEKEFRESSRSLSASHTSAISRLESRVCALTARIEKQMALIDNLRKQNAILSTETALKALEKEYCNFLNQDL